MQEALILERQHLQAQLTREVAASAAAAPHRPALAASETSETAAADGAAATDDSLDAFMSSMDRQVEVDKVWSINRVALCIFLRLSWMKQCLLCMPAGLAQATPCRQRKSRMHTPSADIKGGLEKQSFGSCASEGHCRCSCLVKAARRCATWLIPLLSETNHPPPFQPVEQTLSNSLNPHLPVAIHCRQPGYDPFC